MLALLLGLTAAIFFTMVGILAVEARQTLDIFLLK